ncbi:MAG: S9 family peptidase [Phycisphaerales bacterium]|nr:S9 family peptidase [Phycisphaerales bacterium]
MLRRTPPFVLALSVVARLTVTAAAQPLQPPPTETRSVDEARHGLKLNGDYRWLEDVTHPEVQQWVEDQNAYAAAVLAAVPRTADMRARLAALASEGITEYRAAQARGDRIFALKFEPPRQQAFVVVRSGPDPGATEKIVFDPGEQDRTGRTMVDWFEPSPDGSIVAVSVSRDGSEAGELRLIETETGTPLADVIPRVNQATRGGGLVWHPDGRAFYYTRYPAPGEGRGDDPVPFDPRLHQKVYFHSLGQDPVTDRIEFGGDLGEMARISLVDGGDRQHVLAVVEMAMGGERAVFLRRPSGRWECVADFGSGVEQAAIGGGHLWLLSRNDAPRGRVLRTPLANPSLASATLIVPQGRMPIRAMLPGTNVLYVLEEEAGRAMLRSVHSGTGQPVRVIGLPQDSSVNGLSHFGADGVLYETQSYLRPSEWKRQGLMDDLPKATGMGGPGSKMFGEASVGRRTAKAADGTEIPVTFVALNTTPPDGGNPVLVEVGGMLGQPLRPRYDPLVRFWVEQGGVYVAAHVRGGGERGPAWHEGALRSTKGVAIGDLASVLEMLEAEKIGGPGLTAVLGRGHSGTPAAAAGLLHPQAVRAVVVRGGLFDLTRKDRDAAGRLMTPELGDGAVAESFEAMWAISPFDQVKGERECPSFLIQTGVRDGRTPPWHAYKLAARLQAVGGGKSGTRPALLRAAANTGPSDLLPLRERIAQDAEALAFVFRELGLQWKRPFDQIGPPAPTPPRSATPPASK